MTCPALTLPDDIDTLKAMLVAMASEKAELQAEAGQLQDETMQLKAELVRIAAINERAEERIANLHMIIKQLERARFGRSSEKLDGGQADRRAATREPPAQGVPGASGARGDRHRTGGCRLCLWRLSAGQGRRGRLRAPRRDTGKVTDHRHPPPQIWLR